MAVLEPYKGGYYLWNYVPSIAAAVIFILLFLVMTALVSWRMFKTKTWFCIPFAIGGFCKPSASPTKVSHLIESQLNSPDTVLEHQHTTRLGASCPTPPRTFSFSSAQRFLQPRYTCVSVASSEVFAGTSTL